ncbi:MAG: hypothetical protein HC892_00340 [Saprospiraceae bacterium]|nr:hypothetical protein [Saprospiraceae bacterium]
MKAIEKGVVQVVPLDGLPPIFSDPRKRERMEVGSLKVKAFKVAECDFTFASVLHIGKNRTTFRDQLFTLADSMWLVHESVSKDDGNPLENGWQNLLTPWAIAWLYEAGCEIIWVNSPNRVVDNAFIDGYTAQSSWFKSIRATEPMQLPSMRCLQPE